MVEAAVKDSAPCIYLEEEGCYYDMELTDEMQYTLDEWELVKDFQDCHIVYQIGSDMIPVDASVVCDWILLKEDGNFDLDDKGQLQLKDGAVEEFIDKLADEYDTVGKSRRFMSTRGDVVEVEGGIYGNQLDKEIEVSYLTEAFNNKADEVHIPTYSQTARQQGEDDIGNTYLEVDMTQQMMYYYLNGRLEVETPIVTGNTSRRMGTPSGVNYVYLKQTDRILRGEGYASHVNFWMPVKGNIGIHDAAWRSTYGGQIYQTNGSHGCINTPYDAMNKIYSMVEVGTPVVMFY
ncbi:MAG: L,D-transpeptidase family protein [Lachnospiraceae bacterium]|nr:L,D-transpeptidase family protein [Lachnospiraceae bacterium]